MTLEREVRDFLAKWAATMERRELEASADLYLRDPPPLVTFTDGERAEDWLDVRVRLARDFERAILERVEILDVVAQEVSEGVCAVSFEYDMTVRDLWGATTHVTRHASMTLATTKDGYRIAAAHFSPARA